MEIPTLPGPIDRFRHGLFFALHGHKAESPAELIPERYVMTTPATVTELTVPVIDHETPYGLIREIHDPANGPITIYAMIAGGDVHWVTLQGVDEDDD